MASMSLGRELDLRSISMALPEAEYDPEKFPGLIYRLKDPKAALLLFSSGKVVCTGAKSLGQVGTVIGKAMKSLDKAGVSGIKEPKIEVQNYVVASADLGDKVDLNAIAMAVGLERVEYEPEQFPGLVYRMDEPKVVLLIFGSGKIVCTGGKRPEDVEAAVDKIALELRSAGLIR